MTKMFPALLVVALAASSQAATTNMGPWTALFKGVEISYVRVFGNGTGQSEKTEAINCLRIDLTDPDIQLFDTPHCTNSCGSESLAENTSHFLETYGLQVAVNCNFYASSFGPNDVPLGTPDDVLGLAISRGEVVSPAENTPQSVAMLFTTSNVPEFVTHNWPATNTAGIFTALGGNILLLTNGMNAGTNQVNDLDPRTAVGISQDKRYLYLMTVDGRQGILNGVNPPWSEGLNFYETADWLARFGAYEAMNVDGGGSTTMVMADCHGASTRLNRSSFVFQYGRERNIGHNVGVYAKPMTTEVRNLSVVPGTTTAIVTWDTSFPADTQVEYGLSSSYGSATPLDSRMVHSHIATLNGLLAGSNYYFRARSSDGVTLHTAGCSFTTTGSVARTLLLGMTSAWKYTTNNLDGVSWKGLADDDSGWFGPSSACFHIENTTSGGITFAPRNTLLPPGFVVPIFRTYYFRTPFVFSGSTAGLSLTFSNYIDDGAIFYLNGAELNRIRVAGAPTPVYSTNYATGSPCAGTAFANDAAIICPDMFTISGNVLTNLVQGTNVIAVEVHNVSGGVTSQDIFFGSALFANRPGSSVPQLFITSENGLSTIFWNGQGFTLQQSSDLSSPSNWFDVEGPVTQSAYTVANNPSMFYRLRN